MNASDTLPDYRSSFVPFAITVCGVHELHTHCAVGVSHVLSILDPGSPEPPAFGSFGEHERLELRFHDIIDPAAGMLAPEPEDIDRILAFGRDLGGEDPASAHLLVHCQMGVSRSTASMLMILAQARADRPVADALAELNRIRPRAWPNLRMTEIADAKLGREGDLVAAARAQHRARFGVDHEIRQIIRDSGRHRELEGL